MTRLTLVCESCHAGWEVDGNQPLRSLCPRCGRFAVERGRYNAIPLRVVAR